jgi:hypothetical protein
MHAWEFKFFGFEISFFFVSTKVYGGFFFCLFDWNWGLNSGLPACNAGMLEPHLQSSTGV